MTVPEVRRLLLAIEDPPERLRFRLDWSTFRRRHQAVAKVCHSRRRAREQAAPLGTPAIEHLEVSDLELTDARWDRIAPLLTPQKPVIGRPNKDHRTILAGILWVIKTGSPWRDLPEEFGPWETIRSRYDRWRRTGIWQQILDALKPQVSPDAS